MAKKFKKGKKGKRNGRTKRSNVVHKTNHKNSRRNANAADEIVSKLKRNKSLNFSKVGGIAGGYLGGAAGSLVGSTAGHFMDKITGLGEYHVNKNSLLTDNGPPLFSTDALTGDCIISHREFIGDIESAVSFRNRMLDGTFDGRINAGNNDMFPWLANIAQQFDKHKWEGLVFEFKTSSGIAVNGNDPALGVVVQATNYDSLQLLFEDRREMEEYKFASSTVASASCLHPIECAPDEQVLDTYYTWKDGIPSTGSDTRFSVLGNYQIAVVGQQAFGNVLGELWVSYKVRLMIPRLDEAAAFAGNEFHFIVPNVTENTSIMGNDASGITEYANNTLVGVTPVIYTEDAVLGHYAGSLLFADSGFYEVYIQEARHTGVGGLGDFTFPVPGVPSGSGWSFGPPYYQDPVNPLGPTLAGITCRNSLSGVPANFGNTTHFLVQLTGPGEIFFTRKVDYSTDVVCQVEVNVRQMGQFISLPITEEKSAYLQRCETRATLAAKTKTYVKHVMQGPGESKVELELPGYNLHSVSPGVTIHPSPMTEGDRETYVHLPTPTPVPHLHKPSTLRR